MDRDVLLREAAEAQLLREASERRFLYADVEQLLNDGFLTQNVQISEGVYIVVQSLSDLTRMNFNLRSDGDGFNWKRHLIAHSVVMVNGYYIDHTNPNAAYMLFKEWLEQLRLEWVDVLYTYVVGLINRSRRAMRITHAYCHEKYSRTQWLTHGKPLRMLNNVQRMWVAYNEAEDRYERDLGQWGHTRAVAASMSNKAAKMLQKNIQSWQKKRDERTERAIEDGVNWVISGERAEQEPITVTVNGETYEVPKVHASQTVDEMEAEMMRAVRGEKDYHDLIVDQYKEYHRARLEKARLERQEAIERARAEAEEKSLEGSTSLVGYTAEQLAEINPKIRKAGQPVIRREAISPERNRFNKYVETDVRVGWIGKQGVPEAAEPTGDQPAETGSKEQGVSLQDQIARRRPTIREP